MEYIFLAPVLWVMAGMLILLFAEIRISPEAPLSFVVKMVAIFVVLAPALLAISLYRRWK